MPAGSFNALPSSPDDRTSINSTRKRRSMTKTSNNEDPICKPSLSSMLLSLTFSKTSTNKNAFRGLGCASAPDVYNPSAAHSVVRSSANWETNKSSNQRPVRPSKGERKKKTQIVDSDVWCAPGIPFSTDAESVDCVVSRRPWEPVAPRRISRNHRSVPSDSAFDMDTKNRERPYIGGPSGMFEDISEMKPFPVFETLPPINYGYMRGPRRESVLAEIVLLQSNVHFGRMSFCDPFHDWRLDIDNMTYEELLELGDKIGYVNAGLQEGQISRCLSKMKCIGTVASNILCENERKCCICQEEYERRDDAGKLSCGHSFHMCCIKQWLLRKNACPFCKAVAYHR